MLKINHGQLIFALTNDQLSVIIADSQTGRMPAAKAIIAKTRTIC